MAMAVAAAAAVVKVEGEEARSWSGFVGFGLATSLVALLVLNLLDGLFTLSFLQLGLAEEANPLMRWAYERSPLAFMASKLLLVHLGAWMLWINRHSEAARAALAAGVLLYAGIVAYHCSFLLAVILT